MASVYGDIWVLHNPNDGKAAGRSPWCRPTSEKEVAAGRLGSTHPTTLSTTAV